MTAHPVFGYGTHTGYRRSHNEDSYLAAPELGLWLVADGMGGYEGGEVASAIVIEQVGETVAQGGSIMQALQDAHVAVLAAPEHDRGQAGMGSTAVCLLLQGAEYEIAWVGDSRAYLWNGQTLTQLTHDHSLVQQYIDRGEISEKEAEVHPQRHVISQAIGSARNGGIQVDSICGELSLGESILLCSDGLTEDVPLDELQSVLSKNKAVQVTSDLLIAAALEHGGSDNVTVIIVSASIDCA